MTFHSKEEFRPIPQRRVRSVLGTFLFHARLAVDLQALTIYRFIKPFFDKMNGRVLDVGCGEMPYRHMLPATAEYIGIDVPDAAAFDMAKNRDVRIFDGTTLPLGDATCDHVMCTEVLEHAADPVALIAEIHRVLRPGGTLLMTVPFAARVHFAPHDYRRLTPYGLSQLLAVFRDVHIEPRGNDLAVVANKLIVICARMRKFELSSLLRLPGLLFFALLSTVFLPLAHISLVCGWGSPMDPLGYGVTARK